MSTPEVRKGTLLRIYNQHLINLKNVSPKIDNKAPKLPISVYLKDASFYADIARLRDLERQNKNLLKDINLIYRTKGKVDCQLEKYVRPKTMYHCEKADHENKRKRTESFLHKLVYVNSSYSTKKFLKEWEKILKIMKHSSKYPEFYDKSHSKADVWTLCPNNVMSYPATHEICFLDLKIGNLPKTVRIEIELYNDIFPETAANFACLCRGHCGLTYQDTVFHRVVLGLWCVGGDVVNHSGTGGASIYGPNFPDENFILQHNGPGVVAMYTSGSDENNSQFLITFKKLASLNGKYVVFGRVRNLKPLVLIESCGTKGGKPLEDVRVKGCGVYEPRHTRKLTSHSRQSTKKSSSIL